MCLKAVFEWTSSLLVYFKIKSLINLTDNSYIYDEVIAMERHVLKGLDYQLSIPTPLVFLHWFLWRLDCKEADRELVRFAFLLDSGGEVVR